MLRLLTDTRGTEQGQAADATKIRSALGQRHSARPHRTQASRRISDNTASGCKQLLGLPIKKCPPIHTLIGLVQKRFLETQMQNTKPIIMYV